MITALLLLNLYVLICFLSPFLQFWLGLVHSLASVFILLFTGVLASVSTSYGNNQ